MMIQTTLKYSGVSLALALMLGWLAAAPAQAREPVPEELACHLYEGEISLDALTRREKELTASDSASGGGLCERANIHYQLARLLPDRQKQHLNTCIGLTGRAIGRDSRAGVAYFFRGLCLGRLGETKGVWGSLKIIEPFRESMETAATIDPAIDSGGPHRALGRLYYKLPLILGGDMKKSIAHLRKAVAYGPQYWENHFFLAESYYENKQYQKARAELQRAIDIESQLTTDPDHMTRTVAFRGLMKAIENHIH